MHPLLSPIVATVGPLEFDPASVVERFRRRELASGEQWLRPGQTCRRLAFIEVGKLRHYRQCGDKDLTRWGSFAGQYITAMSSFIHDRPSEEGIEATEASVVWELNRDTWAELRALHPQLQAFWVTTLEHLLTCFDDRVWSLIAGDAEQRYGYMIERYPEFLLALPQHYVADMLGIAPRHLSRVRRKLASRVPSF